MKARVFTSLAEAEAAQRSLDLSFGLPRVHAGGSGPDDYEIRSPGAAGERIRARGVRTAHRQALLAHPDGTSFALPDAGAADLSLDWFPSPRS